MKIIEKNICNSEIHKSAKLYKDVRIINSIINNDCCIGDDSDLVNTYMEEKSELGRRNIIRDSHVGKGSYTGTNTIMYRVDIGRFCSIGWNVSMGGATHQYDHISMYTGYWFERTFGIPNDNVFPKKRTIIGNDVWIASGANVLSGITIGDGSVIGAGAVVTKDVPPYSIVAGIPANVIKKRFSDDIIELLLQLKWWEWDDKKVIKYYKILTEIPNKKSLQKLLMEENL